MSTVKRATSWGTLELTSKHLEMEKSKVDRLIDILATYFVPRKIECKECGSLDNMMDARVTLDEDVILFEGKTTCDSCEHVVEYNAVGDPLKMSAERQRENNFGKGESK
ncbi:hypothetical protein LCGC14_2785570 [marine sediment metagenome]|uniref:Uncharacterized protein n=1 Tax=marine sediment metagenome TaxID=412755 RepID=A0A0F8YS12_9ZZZZ